MKKGFTLIELLIVVAIIAILAAIAVPNFLEAQVRSKVSRVKADFRTIATAIESYAVDWNKYPPDFATPQFALQDCFLLTTPMAYITSVGISDPFFTGRIGANYVRSYQYFNAGPSGDPGAPYAIGSPNPNWGDLVGMGYINGTMLKSWGPNAGKSGDTHTGNESAEWVIFGLDYAGNTGYNRIYDPTNGTISRGDILRIVGDRRGVQYQN